MRDRAKGLLRQLRALFRRDAAERDLEDELAFHIEMAAAENERRGMSRMEARRAALVSFGGVERYAERVREARWIRSLEDAVADIRYAARTLARRPAFAVTVIATLALGIGGTTAIFSVVDGLFLRAPEGVSDASALRRIYIVRDEGSIQTEDGGPGSWVDYQSMRAGAPAFANIAAFIRPALVDLGRGAEAEQVRATAVSRDYLQVLGIAPALGRLLLPEEDATPGAHPVAVISHAMWQTRFGGAADVIGRTMLLNGQQMEIVGVLQEGFRDLHPDAVDVWLPSSMASAVGLMFAGEWRTSTGMAAIDYVARLEEGADEAVAIAQAEAALRHAAEADASLDPTPQVRMTSLTLASTPGGGTGMENISLWLVLVAGIVLVIACANVINLLLTRAVARRRELAVRLAMGGSRWRIARQQLTESMLLALLGGAAGVLVALIGIHLLRQFPLPPSAGQLDVRLLTFAVVLSIVTGIAFGILPALRSARLDPITGIRDSRAAGSIARTRTRRLLVALQVSLSLALLVGAGLFVGSLRQVNAIDGGVDLDRLLTISVDLGRAGYSSQEREQFYDRALDRVSALHGVERAAMIHFEPYSGSGMGVSWHVPGREAPDGTEGPYLNMAGVGYFETVGTRLLAGRTFDERDRPGSEPVAVVNEAMALLMADGGDIVGACVPLRDQVSEGGCTRIIGVVETQRRHYLDDKPVPVVFLSRAQAPNAITWGGPVLLVRTVGEPAAEAAAVRAAVQALSTQLPYVKVQPLTERVRRDVMPFRLGAVLFSLFGVLALALAAIGLYGVLGYFVTERTSEIGIRRSLGSPVRHVVTLVLRQGMAPVTIGVAMGGVAAFAGTRFLASLLFGVDARDPVIFACAALLLMVVSLFASIVPALRAARVSPLVALRND